MQNANAKKVQKIICLKIMEKSVFSSKIQKMVQICHYRFFIIINKFKLNKCNTIKHNSIDLLSMKLLFLSLLLRSVILSSVLIALVCCLLRSVYN